MRRLGAIVVLIALACAAFSGCAGFDFDRHILRIAEDKPKPIISSWGSAPIDTTHDAGSDTAGNWGESGGAPPEPADFTGMKTWALVIGYHDVENKRSDEGVALHDEIVRRELGIESWEWKHIDAGEVVVGMSFWGTGCAWGKCTTNSTTTARGTSWMLHFLNPNYGKSRYASMYSNRWVSIGTDQKVRTIGQ